ncbi:MAG TPA: RluA family pseudouridine synthase [Acidimicrobiales bacterium]
MTTSAATVPGALAGERLDRVVAVLLDCTRSEAAALVAEGAVTVDGAVSTKGSARVEADARVEITREPADEENLPKADPSIAFDVVFEDDHVIVVDKPAGLVVHPGAGNTNGTLVNGLLARYPEITPVGAPERPGIVHRLDKDTSGLLLVARTPDAHAALTNQLKARSVTRRYLALVWGHFDSPRGVVDAPIGRSARTPTRMTVSARGRDARTTYEVIEAYTDPAEASLVWCALDTGRTHQIRVHLAAIGHPVVGDGRYGGRRTPAADVGRFFLHAAQLGFDHPVTGEPLTFESSLPADLAEVQARFSSGA